MTDLFWKVITVVCLGAMLFVIYTISTGKNMLNRFLLPGSVVETASATILKLDRESQLVTATAFVQAVARKKDMQVYGNAEVVRIVPAKIHYALDLNQIDRSKMEYETQAQTLWVPLPDVKIQSIDPDMEKAELIKSLDLLRTESGIGNQLEQETERMVRPNLEKLGTSPDIIRFAKDQAIIAVRQLLEASLEAVGHRVRVRPYFLKDGKPETVETTGK